MSAPTLYKYAIWAPDYADDGCLARRLAVREQHFQDATPLRENGLGGAMLQEGSELTDQPKMRGSLLVYEAASIDDVWRLIKQDIYYTGGVWDKERLEITPFRPANGM
ncbi:hypothetical protein EUX98_g8560 [Antrodiella citrinella]|uniref:YCII-related domain-containing protein n=1 Tax=Antrodiella citrinella TaxID=2447956 RepID=A0A4S4M5K2_9APHY|nr:hypothetical protein EUX98_g8560 [Antrodiella citrinella]